MACDAISFSFEKHTPSSIPNMEFPMNIKKCFSALMSATVASIILILPAQAALLSRDLTGDGVTDAFYDTVQDITWLRDGNYAKTSGFDANGLMSWTEANSWAAGLVFGGYADWRLPTTVASSCDAPSPGFAPPCTQGEMTTLWNTELGNSAGVFVSNGGLQNIYAYGYWSETEYAPGSYLGLSYDILFASGFAYAKGFDMYALAVRRGDVISTTVPEPGSLLLVLAALGGFVGVRRRQSI